MIAWSDHQISSGLLQIIRGIPPKRPGKPERVSIRDHRRRKTVPNREGDCLVSKLRPGNVHSAARIGCHQILTELTWMKYAQKSAGLTSRRPEKDQ